VTFIFWLLFHNPLVMIIFVFLSGLIQLKYSLVGIAEGDNEANENDDEGGQFDVESDDEKEGKVELNLDLRGVVDSGFCVVCQVRRAHTRASPRGGR
jgi:hypothetical protein